MSKKLLVIFCLASFIFLPLFSSYAQEENLATESAEEEYDFASMTTYEMFWPVVAGKVPGDRLYTLKLWRDKLIGYLFFSKLKKSEYLKQLANKRLVEAEKLLEIGRESYLAKTLEASGENMEEGLKLLAAAPESQTQFWLTEEYRKDLGKHRVVLERMKEKSEVAKSALDKIEKLIKDYDLEYSPAI